MTVASPDAELPGLVAIVLNYATPDRTILAVRSLQTSLVPPDGIIVVDNGSPDDSVDRLRAGLPDVRILETGVNLGFAGGCNVGIAAALDRGARWILLVNSDIVLAAGAIGAMRAAAAAHPDAGILAPLVVRSDEPERIDSAGISYAPATGRMRHPAHGGDAASFDGRPPFAVTAAMGCVLLVARPVFDRVGRFDEAWYYSFEDIDFCLTARRAGFAVICVPAAIALHHGQASIGRRSPRRIYFAARNHLRLASRCGGSWPRRTIRAAWIVVLNLAFVVRSADAPLGRGLAALVRGTWHHIRGRYGAD
jgi:GT2 family glycosyltransferase